MVLSALVALTASAAPVLHVQPGQARPGDAVLIAVSGSAVMPEGTLGATPLSFVPCPLGACAFLGLGVEHPAGELPVEVVVAGERSWVLRGSIDVLPANFPKRQLKVSRRFTSPSRKDQQRSARDSAAFADAFDRDFEALLPVDGFGWPRPPVITAPFGDLRLLNGKKKSQHFGVDLDGETGAPIYASADGDVVLVRDCFASGNTVLVHHGARVFTAYFHLSAFEVAQGQQVKRGDRLGRVGKTGRVTGPHLHFGAKIDGRWVDPLSLLRLDLEAPATRSSR